MFGLYKQRTLKTSKFESLLNIIIQANQDEKRQKQREENIQNGIDPETNLINEDAYGIL